MRVACRLKFFYSISYFSKLIMNINCDKNLENLYNGEDEYRSYFQKIIKMQVIQQIFEKF